ncbi:FecR family protein [Ekhidna sp.]|uniref:FecR family protein n=1 Tax=Ekhidna sp. TaxID=2608089 RepID=UPI003298DA6F
MKYRNYSVVDFVTDDFFVAWVKHPNEESSKFWNEYIISNPDQRQVISDSRSLVLSISYAKSEPLTSDEYLETLENIIKGTPRSGFRWKKVILPVAATVALIVAFTLILRPFNAADTSPAKEKRVLVTKENPRGQKSISILPDGTKIHLNAESELIIDSLFGHNERKVYLTGEAYFDVAENKSKPFVIWTKELKTTVLGTSFNIRSFEDEGEASIVVVSGKVEVSHTMGDSYQLRPYDLLRYEKKNNRFKADKINNLTSHIGWKDGILTFENDTFDQVKEKIERWYDVTIQADFGHEAGGLYSASYDNKSLIKVLDGWSYTSGFSYKKTKDNIIILTLKP